MLQGQGHGDRRQHIRDIKIANQSRFHWEFAAPPGNGKARTVWPVDNGGRCDIRQRRSLPWLCDAIGADRRQRTMLRCRFS